MKAPLPRRNLLLSLAGLSVSQILPLPPTLKEPNTSNGFALSSMEGEHLVHFRDHGAICIKTGLATGSPDLAIGTQQVMKGSGIPIHRHTKMDEAFVVLDGSGTLWLNDVRANVERDAFLYIPQNSWHGFENPNHELLLLWIMTPAGLDGFFRETCSPPGAPLRRMSRDQIRAVALKYNTEFR